VGAKKCKRVQKSAQQLESKGDKEIRIREQGIELSTAEFEFQSGKNWRDAPGVFV
jgi:hypothetical protein